jgi:hypothetical protein
MMDVSSNSEYKTDITYLNQFNNVLGVPLNVLTNQL